MESIIDVVMNILKSKELLLIPKFIFFILIWLLGTYLYGQMYKKRGR